MSPKLEMKQVELNKEIYIEQFKSSQPHFLVRSDMHLDPRMIYGPKTKSYFITFEYWIQVEEFIKTWFKSHHRNFVSFPNVEPNVLRTYRPTKDEEGKECKVTYFTVEKI